MGRPRKQPIPNQAVILAAALAGAKRGLDKQFEQAVFEASQTASLRDIAREVELSPETVRRIVQRVAVE
jgi:hypothetical protein